MQTKFGRGTNLKAVLKAIVILMVLSVLSMLASTRLDGREDCSPVVRFSPALKR